MQWLFNSRRNAQNTPGPPQVVRPRPDFLSPQRNVANEDSGHRNKINLSPAQHTAPAKFTGEVIRYGGRRSVLVVDDEENFLTLLKWFLTARGFDIVTTPSAQESLDLVQQRDFDIALLDIKLGTTDGLTLMDSLTERQPGLKVIVMTAYPTVSSIRQAFDKGAARYLTKPVDLQQLSEAIESL
jgi:two-component system, OmpR family, response regulator